MTTAKTLRHLARDLANAYHTLAELKETKTRQEQLRPMIPNFDSDWPFPDGGWGFNLEHELERDTKDEHIPGGFHAMAKDALQYTNAKRHLPKQRGYLDDHVTPGILCAHIAGHAHEIVERFPAAEDLAELLADQLAFLTSQLDRRQGATKLSPIPADTIATGYGTAADLAPLVSATIGRHIDRKQITYWGTSGRLTIFTQPDGTTLYSAHEAIAAAREYTDRRAGPNRA